MPRPVRGEDVGEGGDGGCMVVFGEVGDQYRRTEGHGLGTVVVVDALPAAPYASRHLPGARNLTIEAIADASLVLPDQQAAIVTYSTDSACNRGPELAQALTDAGYVNVRNYTDGIADWAAAGLPLEAGVAGKASPDTTGPARPDGVRSTGSSSVRAYAR